MHAFISDVGDERILHCKEHVIVAELLEACSDSVTECKEEILKELDDGRKVTVLTSSSTYSDRLQLQVYIDGASGREELMKGQVAVVVLCFVFPDDVREVTYQGGGRGRKYTVAPPRDRRLYCALDGHLSEASRQALCEIKLPKQLLYWGLCRLHGIQLADNWLETRPPPTNWIGEPPSRGILLTFDP